MLSVDTSPFDRALGEYLAKCPDDLEQILNRKMYFVLRGALERTPRADPSKVEEDLQVIAYKARRSRKTGKTSRGQAVTGGPAAAMIIQAARKRRGLKGLYGKNMAKAVSALIGRRRSAVGTERRGWTRALLQFAAASRSGSPPVEYGARPSGAGGGKIATPSFSPEATSFYEINIGAHPSTKLVYNPKEVNNPHLDPRVEAAMSAAFDAEEASMREYVEREIQRGIDEANR